MHFSNRKRITAYVLAFLMVLDVIFSNSTFYVNAANDKNIRYTNIDDFESYSGNEAINSAWSRNENGSEVFASLEKEITDSTAMKFQYSLGSYAGLTKAVSNLNLKDYEGLEMWYQSDGSGNKLTIQMQDTNKNYWEYYINLKDTKGQTVKIPFKDFRIKEGYGDADAVFGSASFVDFSIYVDHEENAPTNGSLYFDDIRAYRTVTPVEKVTLDSETLKLEAGASAQLQATVFPQTATDSSISWESSDDSVATVSKGKVTAKKKGSAVITARSQDAAYATCKVTVTAKADKVIDSFDSSISGWAGAYSDSYNTITNVSYDNMKNALKVALDYKNKNNAEAKIYKNFSNGLNLGEREYLGYSVTYPAELDGKWGAKIYGSTNTRDERGENTSQAPATTQKSPTTQAPATTQEPTKPVTGQGLYVKGTKLYDASGTEFVMRGINLAHTWYKDKTISSIQDTAKLGSNTSRIVLSNGTCRKYGGDWDGEKDDADTVKKLINTCRQQGQVAVLEVHDVTGKDDTNGLDEAVDYWIALKDILNKNADNVIVNIANEWQGTWPQNMSNKSQYKDAYVAAVKKLREAGIKNVIMIDAPGWGQDSQGMFDACADIKAADTTGNIMFSVHMYAVAGASESQVKSTIDTGLNKNICMVIGEFGWAHGSNQASVAYQTILNYSQEKKTGWLAWSWSGNGGSDQILDLCNDFNAGSLTTWGENVVNGENGIKKTAKKANFAVAATSNSAKVKAVVASTQTAKTAVNTKGLYVDGNKMYDAKGNEFVMRGINIAHAWFTEQTQTSIKRAAELGCNTVRVVLSDGSVQPDKAHTQWTKTKKEELEKIITLCKQEGMICVVEVHDHTGYDGTDEIDKALSYWKEMKEVINENKDYVVLNIANEWLGTWDQGKTWSDTYAKAVQTLRQEGFENLLMVDASGYGQESKYLIQDCQQVLQADDLHNTMFSYHMYSALAKEKEVIQSTIDDTLAKNVCLCIGEFGHWQNGGNVDERTIIDYCQEKQVGWLAWSWKGNGGIDQPLDLAEDFEGTQLTDWGNVVFYGKNGIQETSKMAYTKKSYSGPKYTGKILDEVPIPQEEVEDKTETAGISCGEFKNFGTDWKLQNQVNSDMVDCTASTFSDLENGGKKISLDIVKEKYPTLYQTNEDGWDFSSHKTLDLVVRNNCAYPVQVDLIMKTGTEWEWNEPNTPQHFIEVPGKTTQLISFQIAKCPNLDDVKELRFRLQGNADIKGTVDLISMGYDLPADSYKTNIAELNRPKSASFFTWAYPDTSFTQSDKATTGIKDDVLTIGYQGVTDEKCAGIQTETKPGLGVGLDFSLYNTVTCTIKNTGNAPVHITFLCKNGPDWTWAENGGSVDGGEEGERIIDAGQTVNVTYFLKHKTWKTKASNWQYTDSLDKLDDVRALAFKVYAGSGENIDGSVQISNFKLNFGDKPTDDDTEVITSGKSFEENAVIDEKSKVYNEKEDTYTAFVYVPVKKHAMTVHSLTLGLLGKTSNFAGNITIDDIRLCDELPQAQSTDTKVAVTGVTLQPDDITLTAGQKAQLQAEVMPKNATNPKVEYESSNEKVATVDANGEVTAVAAGTAEIKVTTKDGSYTATSVITVKEKKKEEVEVTGVQISESSVYLLTGKTKTLKAQVIPENATNQTVSWKSADPEIAEVTDGVVVAKKAGNTTVFVTTDEGKYTAKCKVYVTDEKVAVTGVTMTPEELAIGKGQKKQLQVSVLPKNATNTNVTYESSNEKVATVDAKGVVTALAAGTANITVVTEDGSYKATTAITVTEEKTVVEVTGVTLKEETLRLLTGQKKTLQAQVIPEDATNQTVSWKSADPEIAEVTDGVVVAKKAGNTTVFVTTDEGKYTAKCKVYVTDEKVAVTDVTMTPEKVTLSVGQDKQMRTKVLPENATNTNVTYESSNEKVAIVDAKGLVTALAAGAANITVVTEDGSYKAVCKVTVTQKTQEDPGEEVIPVTGIVMKEQNTLKTLTEGERITVKATVVPENATNPKIIWKSSDKTVAHVVDGTVIAVKEGFATITAYAQDETISASFDVCVLKSKEDVSPDNPNSGKSDTEKPADSNKADKGSVVAVTAVTFDKTEMVMEIGQQQKVKATVMPENASDKTVQYMSLNPEVAVVLPDGTVTAKKAGDTVIVAISADGQKRAYCNIKVRDAENTIELDQKTVCLLPNKSKQLQATVYPAATGKVTWISDNPAVAVVDVNGKVTAIKPGIAVIIAKTADGKSSTSCQILVKPYKVTKLKKSNVTAKSAKLTWKKQVDVKGYRIYKYNKKTKKYKLYKVIKKNKNSYRLKGLHKNTTYKLAVAAYVNNGKTVLEGAKSKMITVKTRK